MSMAWSWVQKLLGYEVSENESCSDEEHLLAAATSGDITSLLSLLHTDANVNAVNSQNSTPLHLAIKRNHTDCFEVLLRHPQIELQNLDKWGRTPLHTAVIWQRLDLLKRLVEHEPDSVNIPDMDGKNVLHIASASGATEFVKYLITTKVKKNSIDHRRWTPLMCAVAIQDIDTVRVLLQSGVSCNEPFRHNSCMSALRLAIEKHHLEMVKLLLDYGAMVEFTVTVNLGSFTRGRRHSFICHNLATVAIENVDLLHPQSIEIAHRVIQASPAAPDEDACLKIYEMYVKPTRRLQRSISRELLSAIETITDTTVAQIYRLLSLSFAVGIDLNKSNIDRLKRKFRLSEDTDQKLFKLIKDHKQKSLQLQSALAIRKHLIKSGHNNIVSALQVAKFPPFVHEMVNLDWW